MTERDDASFARFLEHRGSDLRRISRHTRGESSIGDVQSEAWLLLVDMQAKGTALDLDDPQHQKLLISHLYQQLVRYTELQVRNAVRLDHAPSGEPDAMHPLAHLLAAAPHYDPAIALIQAEEARATLPEPDAHHSQASAYVSLLRMFDNRMKDVADHLMISLSYCYYRCRFAKLLAVHQKPLPSTLADAVFTPKPWRRFRIVRPHIQLVLDFDGESSLSG